MDNESKNIRLNIDGMTCVNCQNKIEKKLNHTNGVVNASVSYNNGTADVVYNEDTISVEDIIAVIESLDYEVLGEGITAGTNITNIVSMLVIIASLYIMLQSLGILNRLVPNRLADTGMGYGMLLVIGLITSVHCIAMCGGINLSQSIPQKARMESGDNSKLSIFHPTMAYNLGRVASYTAVGFVLGTIGFLVGGGAEVGISTLLQGVLKIIAGLFMIVMGINMLGLIPGLRKFSIRMPRFLVRIISRQSAAAGRPFIIGILNGFMPCGPLQSMWIVAFAAGNPFAGALSMFLFSLGTVPLMMGLGSVVSALGKKFTDKVMTVGAVLVTVLGLAMLSQGVSLSGWLPSFRGTLMKADSSADTVVEIVDGVQIVNSTLAPGGYPNIAVQAGIPVRWVIDAPEGSINGCNYKAVIQDYGIEHTFEPGDNVIEFTPTETGTVHYSCWMGMIQGSIFVTDGA